MNNDQNKFKIVLMGIFGFFILIGLVSFSTYKSTNSSASLVDINIWGTLDKGVFDRFITKYEQDNATELRLIYTFKPQSKIDSELIEAIATKKAPDVILLPHSLEKRYLDKVYLIPFTSVPERLFRDTFIQQATLYLQTNGIFALPFFVDPVVMYWNRDIFSNVNIAKAPTKWSEFPDLVASITKTDNDANIAKSAVALGEYSNVDNFKAILSTIIMQAGSPIVSYEDGLYSSNLDFQPDAEATAPTENALSFFTDFSNPKKKVYSWNRSLNSSLSAFLSEDLAVYFGMASEYSSIKEKNSNLNFDVSIVPQTEDAKVKTTYGELYGFSILDSSPNIVQAFNTVSTLIGTNAVSVLTSESDLTPARIDLISAGTKDPIKTIFYNSALISKGWIDPDQNLTTDMFQNMIDNITTGKMTISDAVSKASLELNNLLK